MIDIAQRLGLWIPQVSGRYLNEDWNPTNLGFGAQCWDVAANWSRYLGLPVISTGNTAAKRGRWPGWAGNMVDVFPQTPAIAAGYELVGPDRPGRPGDIVVWGDSNPYYPKTHVAVLVRDPGGLLLLCISQNSSASLPGNPYPEWTTGPTILQHLPRKGLLGFIRPRTGLAAQGTITQTSEEDDVALTPEEKKALALIVEHLPRFAEQINALDDRTAPTEPIARAADLVLRKINPTDWPDGSPMFIAAQADIDGIKSSRASKYVTSEDPDQDTIYEEAGGELRGLTYTEWQLLHAAGERAREVPQFMIDLAKKAGA